MKIDIEFSDREAREGLERLRRAGHDMTPAMRDIAAALEDSVLESFDREQAPDGTPWPDLAESTKARRARRGTWPGQVLQVDGARGGLVGSISSDYDSMNAVAGTNKVYGAVHQFGATEGEFGTTGAGMPIPFGDIPARPFLGVSEDAREDILDAINDHFRRAVSGR